MIDYKQNNDLSMMQSTMLILSNFNDLWDSDELIKAVVNEFKTHLSALLTTRKLLETGINDIVPFMITNSEKENPTTNNYIIQNKTAYRISANSTTLSTPIDLPTNTNIDLHIRAVKALLNEQLDTLISKFKTSSASFYNQYTTARSVTGYRHNHLITVDLKGFIYNQYKMPLTSVLTCLSGETSCQMFTDKDGTYRFERLHTGTYTITASLACYITQTKTIQVMENGITEIDFVMLPLDNQ
jgi:hypothetical protein